MPSPALSPPVNGHAAIGRKLKAHKQHITELLTQRADLKATADRARERFAAEPDYMTDSQAFREADAAVKARQYRPADCGAVAPASQSWLTSATRRSRASWPTRA